MEWAYKFTLTPSRQPPAQWAAFLLKLKSQGNTSHYIMSEENKVWHRALANSSTQGNYGITLDDNLSAASIWNFKYNTLATAKSTMKNVKLKIDYEYDVTTQF